MTEHYLSLKTSEGIVAQMAATIYAAYIAVGKVQSGQEQEYMKKSLREAIALCKAADSHVTSDDEMG